MARRRSESDSRGVYERLMRPNKVPFYDRLEEELSRLEHAVGLVLLTIRRMKWEEQKGKRIGSHTEQDGDPKQKRGGGGGLGQGAKANQGSRSRKKGTPR